MRWFKHFSDNHRGRTVRELMSRFGHQGPCCYYFLMEMCAEKLEVSDLSANQEFVLEMKLVRQMLGVSQTKLEQILNVCQTFVQLSFRIDGTNSAKFLKIKMPILLELLDRDLKKPRSKRATTAKKARLDIDIDVDVDKEEEQVLVQNTNPRQRTSLILFKNEQEVLSKIPIPTMDRWLALYDAEYLRRETLKAWNYYANNPRKVPKSLKGWTQALSSWYERGWKYHVKEIASVEDNSADAWLRRKLKEEQSL